MWVALLPDKNGLNLGVNIFGLRSISSKLFFSKYTFFEPVSEAKLMDFSFGGWLFSCMNVVLSHVDIFTPVFVCIFLKYSFFCFPFYFCMLYVASKTCHVFYLVLCLLIFVFVIAI